MKQITIVTGGSRGIGAATARLCGANGHTVCVAYRSEGDLANEVVADIEKAGGAALPVQVDTAAEADVLRLFETVDKELGPVTGLVNNAGIHGPRVRLEDCPAEAIESVLKVNVLGYFLCAREAVRRMSTERGGQGGAIVNVSSGSAISGSPGEGILYGASKGAVNTLTAGLSQEVAGEGIRVNTVSPGLTAPGMPPPEKVDLLGPKLPMGRAGRPEEIAEAIYWLLTDKASYTSGANIRVGGGKP
ncbi:MAG: SDR family oxidoreductase [Alphaproteobacteria bacterium]|nr:SDR family oxidoreductase [Alphaproteobacteria bacterium]